MPGAESGDGARMSSCEQSAEPIVVVEPSASVHVIGVSPHTFGSALLQMWRIGTLRSPRAISRSGWFFGRRQTRVQSRGDRRRALGVAAVVTAVSCSRCASSHARFTLPESAIAPAGGTPSSCML